MDHIIGFYYSIDSIIVDAGVAAAIFLAFLVFRKIFVNYILKLLLKFAKKTKTELDTAIVVSFEKPSRMFLIILGIYFALLYLPLQLKYDLVLLKLFRISVIIFIVWGLYNFIENFAILFAEMGNKFNISFDKILAPFFSRAIKFVLVFLGLMLVISELGYDINGFVAGLGLGGLAFALAAQDTVANIFAGIVIIIDKPFSIGDWINTTGIEGVVEDINFRSSRIRTFANALITVPNSTLANQPITNWTKMGKRRVTFNLGVTYTTPKDKLQKCVERIREMLERHEGVHQDTIFVRFDKFNDSSLDILLYFFTKTTVWGEFLKVKEEINFRIMEILEEEGVSVAFPSRSLYLETPLDISK